MSWAVQVENLRVSAPLSGGDPEIVRGVSLSLRAGERLTLLGESGSGKSILAQAIMGTLPPGLRVDGAVALWGQPVTAGAQRAQWGRGLAMLPQEPWLALNPTMRLIGQVAEVNHHVRGQVWPVARQTADDALESLQLRAAARLYPHQVSGGMAQRAAFAATCAAGAALLIADEPTKGLDADMRDQVAALLQAHGAGHDTDRPPALITITHDVALARRLGGQVAVMLEGRIVEQGPAEQVLQRPTHAYTRELVDADPGRWRGHVGPLSPGARPVVTGRGLRKSMGGRTLFDGVDLAIAQGEVLAVQGPSGCGKTTLGHLMLGLAAPDAGRVIRPEGAAALGFQKLYQDPPAAFAPARCLGDLLQDLIRRHRLSSAEAQSLMLDLQLRPALLDRRPHQVSGGELQRFALLRVLLMRPSFIVADEPTSRLDPIIQQRTMKLLCSRAASDRFGVLLVTHDPAVATHAAHRIAAVAFMPGQASPAGPADATLGWQAAP